MFPDHGEKSAWVSYLFLGVGFIAFLGFLLFEVLEVNPPGWLVHVAGLGLLIGVLLFGIGVFKRRGSS